MQDDGHFLTVCRYVEGNALRAALVTSASDWRFGSLWRLDRQGIPPQPDPWPVPRSRAWAKLVDAPQAPAELEALRTRSFAAVGSATHPGHDESPTAFSRLHPAPTRPDRES